MTINILAIGDVVGQTGLAFLKEHLKPLQKLKGVSFTVVNGENANVVGITPAQADAILAAGADVVTLGNHTWTRWELQPYLDEKARILRPANYAPQCPGRGDATFTTPFGPIRVINLLGRFSLDTNTDNPFPTVDALPAAELGDYLKRFGKPVTVCADPAQAAELALAHAAPEDVICAVGSLYMAGAIRMDLRRDHNENSGH